MGLICTSNEAAALLEHGIHAAFWHQPRGATEGCSDHARDDLQPLLRLAEGYE